jgi:hypothetical protein
MARAPIRSTRFLVPIVALIACAFAAPAFGSAKDVIRDCSEDGVLNGHYSHSELSKALDQLPSDLDEYTDCRAVIRSAELRSAKKHSGPGVGSNVDTTSPPSPQEKQKVAQAAKGATPVNIGGRTVTPGAVSTAGVGSDMPGIVLAVLIALAGAMLTAAVVAIRRHGPAFARAGGPLDARIEKLTRPIRDGIARFRR